jgi:hypothetical protein
LPIGTCGSHMFTTYIAPEKARGEPSAARTQGPSAPRAPRRPVGAGWAFPETVRMGRRRPVVSLRRPSPTTRISRALLEHHGGPCGRGDGRNWRPWGTPGLAEDWDLREADKRCWKTNLPVEIASIEAQPTAIAGEGPQLQDYGPPLLRRHRCVHASLTRALPGTLKRKNQ